MVATTEKSDIQPAFNGAVHDKPLSSVGAPLKPDPKDHIRHGLTAGALPRGCGYVQRSIIRFRVALEQAVQDAGGKIGVLEAALIQSALRWERHALLAQRWLRREADSMTATDRLAYSKAVADASSQRDRCLDRLGLRLAKPSDPWDIIYSAPRATITTTDSQSTKEGDGSDSTANSGLQKASPAEGGPDA